MYQVGTGQILAASLLSSEETAGAMEADSTISKQQAICGHQASIGVVDFLVAFQEYRVTPRMPVTASPSAASKTNPLLPRLTEHRLIAVVTAVSVPIEEGHVIILHIPVGIHHRSVGW